MTQQVGFPVPDWKPPSVPGGSAIVGQSCVLEPLNHHHSSSLFSVFRDELLWTYMPWGPFDSVDDLNRLIDWIDDQSDWAGYAVVADDRPLGIVNYLRIDPPNGSIEVGGITFSPELQRTKPATESMFLMAEHAFDLGYRRYEWKCDALNARSRAAAQRLGFSYEGVFRQATIYKNRNRDTAWYAMIDKEWPDLERAFTEWLDPSNFDDEGRQRTGLSDLTRPILKARG